MTEAPEGLRERKRRQTRQRIVDAGLKLFLEKGVETTTLDEVAAAADISRRSFFSYFGSKDEIVMAWQDGARDALCAALAAAAPGHGPFEAARIALVQLAPLFATHNFVLLDQLMRSSPTLRARKQMHYEEQERALAETMIRVWPQLPEPELKATAMMTMGALRLAVESWLAGAGEGPIEPHLEKSFAALRTVG